MNFVCIVFELGDKMLTLSSMKNLIVQSNLHAQTQCFLVDVSLNFSNDHFSCIAFGHDAILTFPMQRVDDYCNC